jgi:hypothetical protein
MNLRAAKNELVEPPRVQLQALVLEAVGIFVVSYVLVGLFS